MEPFQKVVAYQNPYDCIWQAYMRALLRKRAKRELLVNLLQFLQSEE